MFCSLDGNRAQCCGTELIANQSPGGRGVLDPWLGIGVPLRVSNHDPV